MIVLDASAAVEVILRSEPNATRISERVLDSDGAVHVPHFFELEVLSVLRRYSLAGRLSEERSQVALERLRSLRLVRYPHTPLVERVWELRYNVTAYDASYVVLAEVLGASLITTDGKLARSSGHRASIELF